MAKTRKVEESSGPVDAPAAPAGPPPVRCGTLYAASVDEGISLANEKGEDCGERVPVDSDCSVMVNGGLTAIDDLRRGDRVTLNGYPVTEVIANR